LSKYLGDLKGALGNISTGNTEEEILAALENQIQLRGGLNIGDRWRLRFKSGSNNDLFLQDKLNKGYYRFRTTNCNNVVDGVKTNAACP
jgi:hypothetical protein